MGILFLATSHGLRSQRGAAPTFLTQPQIQRTRLTAPLVFLTEWTLHTLIPTFLFETELPYLGVKMLGSKVWIKGCNTNFDNDRNTFTYIITTKNHISFSYLQSWPILGIGKISELPALKYQLHYYRWSYPMWIFLAFCIVLFQCILSSSQAKLHSCNKSFAFLTKMYVSLAFDLLLNSSKYLWLYMFCLKRFLTKCWHIICASHYSLVFLTKHSFAQTGPYLTEWLILRLPRSHMLLFN
jgi:hypothetical protein